MRKRIKELLDLKTFPERQVQRDLQRLVWRVKFNTRKLNKRIREESTGGAEAERPLVSAG